MHRDIRTAEELVSALRDARIAQGLSCEQVDEIAGLCDRYFCKIENADKRWGRGLGLHSLPLVLAALGLKLTIKTDEAGPWRHPARQSNGPHPVTHIRPVIAKAADEEGKQHDHLRD